MSMIQQTLADGVGEMAGAAFDHVAELVDRGAGLLDESPLGKVTGPAPEPARRHRGRWLVVVGVAALTVGWVVVSRRHAVVRSAAVVERVVNLRDEPVTAPGAMNGHPDGAAMSPFDAARAGRRRPDRGEATVDVTDCTRGRPNSRAIGASRSVRSLAGSTFSPEGRHARAT